MFKKVKPIHVDIPSFKIPHCDPRILHAPGECEFCDKHPEWQWLREIWGIAFTGYEPEGTELPCPADNARGNKHKGWHGNVAKPLVGQLVGQRIETIPHIGAVVCES